MGYLDWSVQEVLRAVLIALRVGAILFALPIFGDSATPVRVRILMAVAITGMLFPLVPASWATAIPEDPIGIASWVVREVLVGLSLGFIARVTFEGMIMAANVVGFQMGFGVSGLLFPEMDGQSNSFMAFHRLLMVLFFLVLGLDHLFLHALAQSFQIIPAAGVNIGGAYAQLLTSVVAGAFSVSLQLAAPILVALMFAMAAMGLMARTVPQLNIFVMSFPVSFFIGLIVYLATLPFFPEWMRSYQTSDPFQLTAALKHLAH